MEPAVLASTASWPPWLLYFRQFDTYFVLFAAAAVATAVSTPVYILAAHRLGWVDRPFGRKRHERATATMGGLVVFAAVFAGAVVALRLDNLVGEILRAHSRSIYALLGCTLCMALLGVIDDRHGVRPRVKLLVQGVVAVAAVALDFSIRAVTLPWLGSVELPPLAGAVLSLLWIVGITNAVNLTDGLDGLAAGIGLLAAAVNAVVAVYLGNHYMAALMALLAGALLGFLRWNFHPARVFLGDAGSLALGMFLALASLHSAQKAHTVVLILVPLLALGYPIFDTLLAVARRVVRGQPLFASDRDHIHHRLTDRSRRPSVAAMQIYVVSVVLCLLCLAAMTAHYFVLGLGLAGVLLMAVFSARVLGYLEWGGWAARWSGREETRVLHAAAQLARLKVQLARDGAELVRAFAPLAAEIGCRRLTLDLAGRTHEWAEALPSPGAVPVPESAPLELPIAAGAVMRFFVADPGAIDEERRQLIEELGRTLAVRLEQLEPAA